MAIKLTLERTKQLLEEAVAEKGTDYVYADPWGNSPTGDGGMPCYYVHDDQPGCIVGHVLYKAGVPLDALFEVEHSPADQAVAGLDGLDVETWVYSLLRNVQRQQDMGVPWGEALRIGLTETGA